MEIKLVWEEEEYSGGSLMHSPEGGKRQEFSNKGSIQVGPLLSDTGRNPFSTPMEDGDVSPCGVASHPAS